MRFKYDICPIKQHNHSLFNNQDLKLGYFLHFQRYLRQELGLPLYHSYLVYVEISIRFHVEIISMSSLPRSEIHKMSIFYFNKLN